jgi:hypothetical protein
VDLKQLRRRCNVLVGQLSIPQPFDLAQFCDQLATSRGRPIHLLPLALPASAPSGLWIAGRRADYIVYEQHTSPTHQRHIVLHEIGHMLCRHQPPQRTEATQPHDLFPSLTPQTVQRILQRTSYSTDEEREAELIASLILRRVQAEPPAPPASLSDDDAAVAQRLADAMERSRSPR